MGKRKNPGWSCDDEGSSSSSSSSLAPCGACSGAFDPLPPPSPPPLPPPKDPLPVVDDRKFVAMLSRFVYTSKKEAEPLPPAKEEVSILERKVQQAVLLGKPITRQAKKVRRTEECCDSKKKGKAATKLAGATKKEDRSHREIVESMKQYSLRMSDKIRVEEKRAEFSRRKRRLRKQLLLLESPRANFPVPAWRPPRSPHRLIQEKIFDDPWKVVIACIFLHRTTGTQTKKMLWNFFKLFPGPQQLIDAPEQDVEPLIKPLGLYKKRLQLIKRFSYEYLHTNWTEIAQLHGVGTYAEDTYMIFVEGRWREVVPDDAVLEQYWNWLHTCSEKKAIE